MRVNCHDAFDNVICLAIEYRVITALVTGRLNQGFDTCDGPIAQRWLACGNRTIHLDTVKNLGLHIRFGLIDLTADKHICLARRRVRWFVDDDSHRLTFFGPHGNGRNFQGTRRLRHEGNCPGAAAPNLTVDNRGVAELADLTAIELFIEYRKVGFDVDVCIDNDLEHK